MSRSIASIPHTHSGYAGSAGCRQRRRVAKINPDYNDRNPRSEKSMPSPAATSTNGREEAAPLYQELEDRILARDQEGGSRVYYELLRRGRPLPEIMAEAVRIHAPYTHVPYHQRIDDGFPNFVNNDHCLLSARAAINLQKMLPEKLAGLPLAQKIRKAPGHYATRGYKVPNTEPPKPVVYWPDQEPLRESGPLGERLNHWLTL